MPNDNTLRAWHFKELRWSLQALAMSASEQLALFPDVVAKADELASDFQHWTLVMRGNYAGELSAAQAEALAAIDQKLALMSRDGAEFDADVWTDAALASNPQWDKVRVLAKAALDAFEWSAESP